MNVLRFLSFATLLAAVACQGFGGLGGLGGGLGGLGNNPLGGLTDTVSKAADLFTQQFGDFKSQFNKVYDSPEEEKKRLSIFGDNQNSILDLGKTVGFLLKPNEWADLATSEFNSLLNGLRINRSKSHGSKFTPSNTPPPNVVDWREKGAVTPVKSQGKCASCYAFAAAGALEAALFKKTGKLESISPQNLVDCTEGKPYENYGCASGAVDPTFDYSKDKGVNTDSNYPYEEKAGQKCRFNEGSSLGKITGYVLLDEGDDKGLEDAVATKGPVAVGIDAHAKSFQFYSDGIYYEPSCKSSIDGINHAVLVIGFGTEANGDKYWLIKNSYGPTWGQNGFGKIARNVTNHCGISTYALYPTI